MTASPRFVYNTVTKLTLQAETEIAVIKDVRDTLNSYWHAFCADWSWMRFPFERWPVADRALCRKISAET